MEDDAPSIDPFSEPPRPPSTPVLRPLGEAPVSRIDPVVAADAVAEPAQMLPPPVAEVLVGAGAPKRRRPRLLIGIGAAVAAAAVVVAVLLVTGGKGADAYSLQAAAANTRAADKIAFTMTMDVMGTSVDMNARVDRTAKMMAMSTDLAAFGGDGGTIDMVLDLGAARMYMDTSSLGADAAVSTKWISIDMSSMPGFEQSLGALTGSNPLDTASLFDNAKNVQDLGREDLNGEKVQHYRVGVSIDDLKKAQPGLFEQLGSAAVDLPESIDYDVWVTKDNEFRKMSFSFDLGGSPVTTAMLVSAVGDIEPIVVPSDADVTDMTDVIGSGSVP